MKAISVVRRLHRWTGLATGAVIVVVSFTGAFLVYGQEIQRALDRDLWELSEGPEAPLPASALAEIIRERHPERRVRSLEFHSDPRSPVVAVVGPDLRLFLHPRSGEIIAEQVRSTTFFGLMEGLHTELLAGTIGHTVVVVSTVVLLIVTLLGLWLWWPQSRAKLGSSFWVSLRRGWKRANYDLHNVLGFYSALVLLLLTVTGVMLAYPELTRSVARVVFPEAAAAARATPGGEEGDEATGGGSTSADSVVDAVVAHAAAEYPEALRASLRFPPPRGGPLTIIMGMSALSEPREDHRLTYDARTGNLLTHTRHSDATAAEKASRLMGAIHLGTVYGWPTKAIAFLVSLIAGMLPITGAIVWFPRWRRKRRRKRERPRPATGI